MEIIKLFRLHNPTHKGPPFQVFSGTETHSMYVHFGHLVHDRLANALPVVLARAHLGLDDLHDELAYGRLEPAVVVGVVRAVEAVAQPGRLAVRDLRELARRERFDGLCLAGDGAYL